MPAASDHPGLRLEGTRLLILNWRCPWHPQAGGAEQYCWNIATRFAEAGAEVTYATSRPRGLPRHEVRDGITLRRAGGKYTVYLQAALYLLAYGRRFTAVIDSQNGIPFFSPLFLLSGRPAAVLLIHHVHQDQFLIHFRWPLSSIGRFLEKNFTRLVYARRPIVAVSPTTRLEVRRRLRLKGPVYTVPNGVDAFPDAPLPRTAEPSVIYLGRLVAQKRVALLLEAAAAIRPRWPSLKVVIAGSGPERARLEEITRQLGLEATVTFAGWVPDGERARLLASAWILVTPSAAEGWGVTVIEANALGRPALAFRVPGLENSISEGLNGWLVDRVDGLAAALDARLRELADPASAARMDASCRRWAGHFTWERTAERMADLLLGAASSEGGGRRALPHGRESDTATVVHLHSSGGLEGLTELVPSDLWALEGQTLDVLLEGRDEESAIAALEGLGLRGRAMVRVANSLDLLLGMRRR